MTTRYFIHEYGKNDLNAIDKKAMFNNSVQKSYLRVLLKLLVLNSYKPSAKEKLYFSKSNLLLQLSPRTTVSIQCLRYKK